jgi:hypothetical protein
MTNRMLRSAILSNLLFCCAAFAASPAPAPTDAGTTPTTDTPAPGTATPATPAIAKPAAAAPATPKPATAHVVRPVKPAAVSVTKQRYHPERFSKRAELHYGLVWGVDSLAVKWTESGEIIRFSYRVLDADLAQALNDKKSEPSLIDPRAGVSLVVPAMENVGPLRQSAAAEDGKSYWMAFSNKGRLVKRGDRVIVVIGQFRADGLVVD